MSYHPVTLPAQERDTFKQGLGRLLSDNDKQVGDKWNKRLVYEVKPEKRSDELYFPQDSHFLIKLHQRVAMDMSKLQELATRAAELIAQPEAERNGRKAEQSEAKAEQSEPKAERSEAKAEQSEPKAEQSEEKAENSEPVAQANGHATSAKDAVDEHHSAKSSRFAPPLARSAPSPAAEVSSKMMEKLPDVEKLLDSDSVAQALREASQADAELKAEDLEVKDPRLYHLPDDLPLVVKELLVYYYWVGRIPPDCSCTVTISGHGRQSPSKVYPRKKKTSCRLVIHFGPDEVYQLQDVVSNDKKELALVDGAYMMLDHERLTDKTVFVSRETKVIFPSILPEDIEDHVIKGASQMGVGGINKKKMKNKTTQRMIEHRDKQRRRQVIRLRNYRRYTVVIDYGPSELLSEEEMVEIFKTPYAGDNSSGDLSDKLKRIPDHIKASLPGHMNQDLINKVAKMPKLSGMVDRITNNVAADVGSIDEIDGEAVGKIAGSAFKHIDIDEVRENADEINEVVDELMPEMKKKREAKRKERNRKRRAARKRQKAARKAEAEVEEPVEFAPLN